MPFQLVSAQPSTEAIKVQSSKDPITLILNNWTSQIVLTHITGKIFESMGQRVDYSFSTTDQQWGALSQGLMHIQVEVWQGTMATMFNHMVAQGKIVDAGDHSASTREDWWYPDYIEALCPGLPDWRALKKCSALFSSNGSSTGTYIAGPWEKPEAARIRALKMDFTVSTVEAADDLWLALAAAKKNKQPIVLFNWTPNWVEAVYSGKFVEFPDYDIACEQDPTWGINKSFIHDCGNPKNGWLKKAAWSGTENKWPCAFATLQQINFNNETIAKLAAQVDFSGVSHELAANQWLANNSKVWQKWIPKHCLKIQGK